MAITFNTRAPGTNYAFSGGPYSARQTFVVTRILNGTPTKDKPIVTLIWQDGAGRKRTERKPAFGPDSFSIIEILDPVDGAIYIIDPAGVAHRVKVSAKLSPVKTSVTGPPSAARTIQHADGSSFTIEGIGTKMIDGFLASGVRSTSHYPAGSRFGNDKPLDLPDEVWQAVQLGVTIFSKGMTPGGGEQLSTLDQIVVGEPDPAKMRPPAGYRVIEETGPFIVTITK